MPVHTGADMHMRADAPRSTNDVGLAHAQKEQPSLFRYCADRCHYYHEVTAIESLVLESLSQFKSIHVAVCLLFNS